MFTRERLRDALVKCPARRDVVVDLGRADALSAVVASFRPTSNNPAVTAPGQHYSAPN